MHSVTVFVQTSSTFTIGPILKPSAHSLKPSCHGPISELQPLGCPSNYLTISVGPHLIETNSIPYHPCFWCLCQQLHWAHKNTQILWPCPSLDLEPPLEDYFSSVALLISQSICPFLLIRFLSLFHVCQVPGLEVQVQTLGVTKTPMTVLVH